MKAAIIGFGNRGYLVTKDVLLRNEDVEIVSVCDLYEDRAQQAEQLVREHGGNAKRFTDYKEALNVKGLEMTFIFSAWEAHSEIARYSMEKGIPVASEVGCEYSLEGCFDTVSTQKRTGTPYMFMENCCYDKSELLATNMARHGLFGEIVHCSGAYAHDLRYEVAYGIKNRHYRFRNYLRRNCENYPTHELGPIAKLLNINRGNRILSVTSIASKSRGIQSYIKTRKDADDIMKNADFAQGDIVDTLITCANGETVRLCLDTSLPRSYSRQFTVRGTKGSYSMDTNSVFLDGDKEYWDPVQYAKESIDNARQYEEKYLPDIWKNITPEILSAGHGGIDYFVYGAFVDAVKNNTPMPIDVYDGVTWMAVAALSEKSISLGGTPQLMPDFTDGRWLMRKPKDVIEF